MPASGNFIYVLSNPAMPGLLKVGRTKNLEKRMAELYATGVPEKFVLELKLAVKDEVLAEKLAHQALACHRNTRSREFFRAGLREIIEAVVMAVGGHEVIFDRHRHIKEIEIAELEAENERKRQRLASEARAKAVQEYEDGLRSQETRERIKAIEAEFTALTDEIRGLEALCRQADLSRKLMGARPMPARQSLVEKLTGRSTLYEKKFRDFVKPWDAADEKIGSLKKQISKASEALLAKRLALGPELEQLVEALDLQGNVRPTPYRMT